MVRLSSLHTPPAFWLYLTWQVTCFWPGSFIFLLCLTPESIGEPACASATCPAACWCAWARRRCPCWHRLCLRRARRCGDSCCTLHALRCLALAESASIFVRLGPPPLPMLAPLVSEACAALRR